MIRGISCGASRSHRVQSIPADQAVQARQPAISCLGDGGFLTQWGKRFLGRRGRLLDSEALSIAVEGQVKAPGVFPVGPNETLLTSLARAGSPGQTAKLDEVVVFRTVNGQRMGAVFDLQQIRTGAAADPQILDGDTIVVGYSAVKGAFRDFLAASPLLNLFTVF